MTSREKKLVQLVVAEGLSSTPKTPSPGGQQNTSRSFIEEEEYSVLHPSPSNVQEIDPTLPASRTLPIEEHQKRLPSRSIVEENAISHLRQLVKE